MRNITYLLTAVFFSILLATSLSFAEKIDIVKPEEVGMSGKTLSLIDEFAVTGMKAKYYKGAVVLVARHGKICYLKSYGEASKGKPMESDAIFRQASMTEPIVMAAFMQFYEQGRFKLDDPFFKIHQ